MTQTTATEPEAPSPRRARQASAIPFLTLGFRPFFLVAGLWAALALPAFVLMIEGLIPAPGDLLAWHRHEMLFGFAAATVTGFILTAIPNWTGRLPVAGLPLLALALLWLAGRLAMAAQATLGPIVTAGVDIAFLIAVFALILREVLAGKNWRNAPVAGALLLLAAANVLHHAEALGWVGNDAVAGGAGARLAIATLACLISLIGGRIVPSFTRNWIVRNDAGPVPAPFGAYDRIALALTVFALVLWVALPEGAATGIAAAAAGLANLIRLVRWRGAATLRDPLVWVLHLGYLWLAAGLGLIAAGALGDAVPMTATAHGLTIGAIGTMTLAVMSRATLGHTGRALRAGPALTTAYVLISGAAVARLLSALSDGAAIPLLHGAALCWTAAFAIFVVVCGPMLIGRPRTDKTG